MKLPELLAPAGNFEKMKTAVHYGADAVYMGLSDFSLRAKADNFSIDELRDTVTRLHRKNVKVYVTVNIIPHNRDISMIREHLLMLKEISPDAVIVSDPGTFETSLEVAPDIPVHISTQANITNYRTAKFWEKAGAKRLVLSRELSIDEIKEIRQHVSLELECFVHGAICISYSGRCYMSSYINNRSGNLGACTNTCRWTFALMEEQRPGEYFPVYENDRGTYVMSSRDLCMIEHLDKLAEAGVSTFKIEGRMKGINYVAGVVKTYREAVDALSERPYKVQDQWLRELSMFSSRGYTTGMFLGKQPDSDYNHNDTVAYRKSHELVGVVKSIQNGNMLIALRSTLRTGESVGFLAKGIENELFPVTEILNDRGRPVEFGRNNEEVLIPAQAGVQEDDLIRRPVNQPTGQ